MLFDTCSQLWRDLGFIESSPPLPLTTPEAGSLLRFLSGSSCEARARGLGQQAVAGERASVGGGLAVRGGGGDGGTAARVVAMRVAAARAVAARREASKM